MNQFNMEISFDEYTAYIKSKTWDKKRTERLIYDNFQCQLCGNRNNIQVHHLVYPAHKNFGTEPITDLITVCESCHKLIDKLRKSQEPIKISRKYVTDYKNIGIAILFNSKNEVEDFYNKLPRNGNITAVLGYKDGEQYFFLEKYNAFTFSDIPRLKDIFGEKNVKITSRKFKED